MLLRYSNNLSINALYAVGSQRVTKIGLVGFEPTIATIELFGTALPTQTVHGNLAEFKDYLILEVGVSNDSAVEYIRDIRYIASQISFFNPKEIRDFLRSLKESRSISRYSNILKVLKHYTRFIGRPELASNYIFPRSNIVPKKIWSKDELRIFYDTIPTLRMKAFFLTAASSGLRRGELLSLTMDNIDWSKQMIIPRNHTGPSKKSWISFFNNETEKALRLHLDKRNKRGPKSNKIFPFNSNAFKYEWGNARVKSNIQLKVKDLRDFFCQEMGELSVPDRFIDAFCGRTPKSILARHYSDYSPERLKRIYDQAGLKVLS